MLKSDSTLQDIDFKFPLQHSPGSLAILLLTPVSLDPCNRQDTLYRLKRLAQHSDGGSRRIAVAYLLSDAPFASASGKSSLNGLVVLEIIMLESLPAIMPTIPIADASCLLSSIQDYISNLQDMPGPRASPAPLHGI
ncbi:uncharacterized protein BO66DRAFT_375705 [Aspergillus aculeatinus CBS 121060]|uniref:Uncharacterized protein n=1 Tax=Aspergillus aculeatinus CBS 121060 TaxID=1448322 RepID=A0ACD1H7Q0_9EURO|nr:hypothetical protein BO66DRAFT_375705 [Aspergillus aculeatinus CBS 121060]RAH69542.1 hypothetical protein BO66DRAFT_375705 [Aspergillus aculeatinus CBS 121060]